MNRLTIAATASLISGVVLFCDLGLHLFAGLGQGYFGLATIMALGLLGAPAALWLSDSFAPGRGRALGIAGTALVVAGALLWVAAFMLLLLNPDAAFTQRLTPGGSAVMALGMILCGVAVLTSRRLRGWRAVAPLLVGLYFPLQLVLQLTFFLNGKDGQPGPNGVLLGAWGLFWAVCGYAAASRPAGPVEPQHAPLDRTRSTSARTASHAG